MSQKTKLDYLKRYMAPEKDKPDGREAKGRRKKKEKKPSIGTPGITIHDECPDLPPPVKSGTKRKLLPIEAMRGTAADCDTSFPIEYESSEESDAPVIAEDTPADLIDEFKRARQKIMPGPYETTTLKQKPQADLDAVPAPAPSHVNESLPCASHAALKGVPRSGRDLSPPRRTRANDSPPLQRARDNSPPRRAEDMAPRGGSNDLPLPKRPRDESPPRRTEDMARHGGANDLLPPDRARDKSPPSRRQSRSQSAETQRMNEATTAQSRTNEAQSSNDHSSDVIYRGKRGEKITRDEWLKLHEKKKKKHRKQEPPVLEWGGGLVQKEDKAKRLEEEARLMSEPLARYDIDPSLDEELRKQDRWGDPFSQLPTGPQTAGGSESSKGSHAAASRPKCRFPGPLNRFGIMPGYRWDGVVRGNGFEDRFLSEKNRKKLEETESYKWSMEDI